jgi:hypothetical protein
MCYKICRVCSELFELGIFKISGGNLTVFGGKFEFFWGDGNWTFLNFSKITSSFWYVIYEPPHNSTLKGFH